MRTHVQNRFYKGRELKVVVFAFLSLITFLLLMPSNSFSQDGEALFKELCTSCHILGRTSTGPDLIGVNDRHSEEWNIKFIQGSQSVIKSGDPIAVALFESFDKSVMPNQRVSDEEAKAILAYIKSKSEPPKEGEVVEEPEPVIPFEYTPAQADSGRRMFSGEIALVSGGPSCITCHNVNNNELPYGGLFAKDLTNSFSRMGDVGISGMLTSPPFPAMKEAYAQHPITEEEIHHITAFLKEADGVVATQVNKADKYFLLKAGIPGLVVLLLIIALLWNKRKKMVKRDIFARQLKASDAKF